MRHQGRASQKSEPAAQSARPASSSLERLAAFSERGQRRQQQTAGEVAPIKQEAYRWKAQNPTAVKTEPRATPKALRNAWV